MIGTVGACAYTFAKVSRPKLSGSDRSRSTSPVSPLERCSSPSERRSAKCSLNGASGWSAIISRMSRASPGLSSISRTLCMPSHYGRQRDHGEPEGVDRFHDDDEFLEIDRLGHVAVGVEVVGLEH